MNQYRIAGIAWLVAAVLGAVVTVAYRGMDPTWYAITLVASAIAAGIGILLLWRPGSATVLLSTIGAVAWVVMYGALAVIQSAEIEAWPTDTGLGIIGAVAGVLAYRAGREPSPV